MLLKENVILDILDTLCPLPSLPLDQWTLSKFHVYIQTYKQQIFNTNIPLYQGVAMT